MRFTLEITLGNDAMLFPSDLADALEQIARDVPFKTRELKPGVAGSYRDRNGNTVGKWEVCE